MTNRLRQTASKIDHVVAYPVINVSLHEDTYSVRIMDLIAGFAKDHPEVEKKEQADWMDEQRTLDKDGRYFFSVNRFVFEVTKPGYH